MHWSIDISHMSNVMQSILTMTAVVAVAVTQTSAH